MLLETDALGAVTTGYTYGMEGILAQETSSGYAYMLKDVQGSVRLLTDALDAVTASYAYDAYGETIHESGTTETTYRYNGQQYDKLTGNYSLRARYYAPELGRFLSRDKHQGNYENELNRYVYVAANPVMWSDPSGYSAIFDNAIFRKIQIGFSKVARMFSTDFIQGFVAGVLGHYLGLLVYRYITDDDLQYNPIEGILAGILGGFLNASNKKIQKYTQTSNFQRRISLREPGSRKYLGRTTQYNFTLQVFSKLLGYYVPATFLGWMNQAVLSVQTEIDNISLVKDSIVIGSAINLLNIPLDFLSERIGNIPVVRNLASFVDTATIVGTNTLGAYLVNYRSGQ